VSNDQPVGVDSLGEGWLTIAEAAEALEVSAKTIRRRLKAGEITGELVHDPKIGAERWMIDGEALPTAPGAALIPVELLDRLEAAWAEVRESAAEAAKAEQRADFEKDRRQRAEAETDTTKVERDRFAYERLLARAEVEELLVTLQAEQDRRWWQRRSRGETMTHLPPRLQVEPLPLDPEQLEIRKAKLEGLRDGTQEPSDGNNEPEKP